MTEGPHVYAVDLQWAGNKTGVLVSEGLPHLNFGAPTQFGGEGTRWTPEHLIVASLNTCFTLTFMALAEKTKLPVQIKRLPVEGFLTQGEDRRWSFTKFIIRPELVVPKEDQEKTKTLLEKAEKYCLISGSLKGSIVIEPRFAD